MYCPECKINYKGEFKYCVTCNEELLSGKVCEHCHTLNSESARICNLCGEFFTDDVKKAISNNFSTLDKTYKECPACQERFAANKIYCELCGGPLILKSGISASLHGQQKKSLISNILSYLKIY